jgi:NADPH:quinone reductase
MRALMLHELGEPEGLLLEEVSSPVPGPNQVLVDMYAAAVNFPDLLTIQGKYQLRPELPFAPGKEGAGVVVAVGSAVSRLAPGDRVMIQVDSGSFAEQALAEEHECYPIPDGVGFDQAAAIGIAYQTAWFALTDRANVQKDETVLVTGASGSVGLAAMQLAKAVFGCRVIAGLTTMSKAGDARANGADHIIDLSGENLRESIRDQVFAVTDGKGVDAVLEICGGDIFAGALRCLKFRGRLVVVGFTSDVIPEMRVNYLLLKNIAVLGVDRTQYRDQWPEAMQAAQAEIFGHVLSGKISMPVQARFPLEEIVPAFDIIRRREVRGKIILAIRDAP